MKLARFVTLFPLLMLMLSAGCSHCNRATDAIYQASTIDALLVGIYDGATTFSELKENGDFGLGTFNALDGEMIAIDGSFYQAKADGTVVPVAGSTLTPFAVVKFFSPDTRRTISGARDLKDLMKKLDATIPSPNYFYAIRIDGAFPSITVRSVPAQQKPYPGLAEAVHRQTVFHFQNITGTILGFRTPDFAKGINLPGYHFHFIAADRSSGGHVLDCRIDDAVLSLDRSHELRLALPGNVEFARGKLGRDHGKALERAERGTGRD